MEKLMRLPPGFRFCPTDEELVVQYLKRKAMACPLPAAIIPEIELEKYDPWDLPGCHEGEKYFFTLREAKHRKVSTRTNKRATMSGFWKATGKDRPVVIPKRSQVVGTKRVFTFHQGKPLRGVRTEWIMHEYRLVINPEIVPYLAQGEEWTVCRISKKKKRGAKRDEEVPHYYNHNSQVQNDCDFGPSSSSSSSSSSCITNLSNEKCSIGEEASSNLIA